MVDFFKPAKKAKDGFGNVFGSTKNTVKVVTGLVVAGVALGLLGNLFKK